MAGDLFDRGLPPFLSLRLVLETLVRPRIPGHGLSPSRATTTRGPVRGARPPPRAFGSHAGPQAHGGCRGRRRPGPSRDGDETAQVACFPFLHEAHVVDFMDTQDEMHKSYAERVEHVQALRGCDATDLRSQHCGSVRRSLHDPRGDPLRLRTRAAHRRGVHGARGGPSRRRALHGPGPYPQVAGGSGRGAMVVTPAA